MDAYTTTLLIGIAVWILVAGNIIALGVLARNAWQDHRDAQHPSDNLYRYQQENHHDR